MKNFILLLFIFSILSCSKSYKYIEVVSQKSTYGSSYEESKEGPVVITAKNDSLAYIEAYKKFCIAQKVYNDMSAGGLVYAKKPTDFILLNENGNKIFPFIHTGTLDSIKNEIMSLETGIKKYLSTARSANQVQKPVDSATIKKLSPLFSFKKDEFDPREVTWIKHKSSPKYVDQNGIYCYFMKDVYGVSNLRIQIQYYADDWLFIKKYQFSIDGQAFEFIPQNVERDSGNGGHIWEWCDEYISTYNTELIKSLANAKTAKIKFIGNQYHKIKTISQKEILRIKETIDLYIAMGGSL